MTKRKVISEGGSVVKMSPAQNNLTNHNNSMDNSISQSDRKQLIQQSSSSLFQKVWILLNKIPYLQKFRKSATQLLRKYRTNNSINNQSTASLSYKDSFDNSIYGNEDQEQASHQGQLNVNRSKLTQDQLKTVYQYRRPFQKYVDMWVNSQSTKALVLGDSDNTLTLWALEPFILPTSFSLRIDRLQLGFEDNIKCLSLSDDESFIVITRRRQIALAQIDDVHTLFDNNSDENLTSMQYRDVEQQFKETIFKFQEEDIKFIIKVYLTQSGKKLVIYANVGNERFQVFRSKVGGMELIEALKEAKGLNKFDIEECFEKVNGFIVGDASTVSWYPGYATSLINHRLLIYDLENGVLVNFQETQNDSKVIDHTISQKYDNGLGQASKISSSNHSSATTVEISTYGRNQRSQASILIDQELMRHSQSINSLTHVLSHYLIKNQLYVQTLNNHLNIYQLHNQQPFFKLSNQIKSLNISQDFTLFKVYQQNYLYFINESTECLKIYSLRDNALLHTFVKLDKFEGSQQFHQLSYLLSSTFKVYNVFHPRIMLTENEDIKAIKDCVNINGQEVSFEKLKQDNLRDIIEEAEEEGYSISDKLEESFLIISNKQNAMIRLVNLETSEVNSFKGTFLFKLTTLTSKAPIPTFILVLKQLNNVIALLTIKPSSLNSLDYLIPSNPTELFTFEQNDSLHSYIFDPQTSLCIFKPLLKHDQLYFFDLNNNKTLIINLEAVELYALINNTLFFRDFNGNQCKYIRLNHHQCKSTQMDVVECSKEIKKLQCEVKQILPSNNNEKYIVVVPMRNEIIEGKGFQMYIVSLESMEIKSIIDTKMKVEQIVISKDMGQEIYLQHYHTENTHRGLCSDNTECEKPVNEKRSNNTGEMVWSKVILFNEQPNAIPESILIQENAFTVLDLSESMISIYECWHKVSQPALARFKLRTHFSTLWDFHQCPDSKQRVHSDTDLADSISAKHSLFDTLSYNLINRKYLLFDALRIKHVLDSVFKRFEATTPTSDIPLFIFPNHHWKTTPFDLAVHNKQITNVKRLYHYMTMNYGSSSSTASEQASWLLNQESGSGAAAGEERGLLHVEVIDRNIVKMLRLGVNLKQFFSSSLPFPKVNGYYYPEYHVDDTQMIIPCSEEEKSLRQIYLNYEKIVLPALCQHQLTLSQRKSTIWWILMIIFFPILIIYGLYKLCSKKTHSITEEQCSEIQKKKHQLQDQEEKQEFEIEYFVINLRHLLTHDKTLLMQVLSKEIDLSYLELSSLQTIVKYKWETYTRCFFKKQFLFMQVFVIGYITDLVCCSTGIYSSLIDNNSVVYAFLVARTVCLAFVLYYLSYMLRLSRCQGLIRYVSQMWNLIDLLFIANYLIYIALVFYLQYFDLPPLLQPQSVRDSVLLKTLECTLLVLTFLKVTFFLRVYDGLSFLVQMLISVFKDLKYFLLFFSIFIVTFAIFLLILLDNVTEDYQGLTAVMAFLAIAFRTSIGDFNIDSYSQNSQFTVLIWLVWLVTMIVGYIVFMNFIIAVVNESYENCMMKLIAQSYKVKVDLIVQRESVMSPSELLNPKNFPNYLIMRRPINQSSDSEGLEGPQWQGFIKEIKQNQDRAVNKQSENMHKLFKKIYLQQQVVNKELSKQVEGVKSSVEERLKKVENDTQEIKGMLKELLLKR